MRGYVRRDEPDIVDWQPPITDCRLAWCGVVLQYDAAVRKGPGIGAPAALAVC